MANTLTASFRGSGVSIVRGLYQYDEGQILKVEGLNLPAITRVHFSTTHDGGESTTMIGTNKDGVMRVSIPNSLLINNDTDKNYVIYAFIYATEDNENSTVYEVQLPVRSRAKPAEIIGSEDQAMMEETINLVNEYNDKVDAMVTTLDSIQNTIDDINQTSEEMDQIMSSLPQWVKEGTKPEYTADEIGAERAGASVEVVNAHNESASAHQDIRETNAKQNTRLSALEDRMDGINAVSIEDVPTSLGDLESDSTHRVVTDAQIDSWNSKTSFSGRYEDLSDKPTIPEVPESLPNPNKLILTGAASGEYNGSEEVTIHVDGVATITRSETLSQAVKYYECTGLDELKELFIAIECPSQSYDESSVYLTVNGSAAPATIPLSPVVRSYDTHCWIWIKKIANTWSVQYKTSSSMNFSTLNAIAGGWWDGNITSFSVSTGSNPFPVNTKFNIEGVVA